MSSLPKAAGPPTNFRSDFCTPNISVFCGDVGDKHTKALLSWYRRHRRDLPWRRTKDPYKIWVSEIMLQQTTVEAVIPYYERFLKRFPDVASLARAREEEVLRYWSGLGYYSRARNLYKAAQILTRRSGPVPSKRFSAPPEADPTNLSSDHPTAVSMLPTTIKELQQLPGIGRYTAGAIASIAFDVRAPVLDGNVARVLSRLFRLRANPRSPSGQKVFWKRAEEILPQRNCGDFNQALMELGATVCLPEGPRCLVCPLSPFCEARREGRPESYPRGRKKITYRDVQMTAAVVRRGKKVLMVRRPCKGLLKGMWELPMVEGGPDRLTEKWPLELLRPLPVVRHTILNRRIKVTPFVCKLVGDIRVKGRVARGKVYDGAALASRQNLSEATGPAPNGLYLWIPPSRIGSLPTSSMNRKILTVL